MDASCSTAGCLRPAKARGLCKMHYENARRAGSIAVAHPGSYAERFDSKLDRRGPNECWPWLAAINNKGYGLFGYHDGTHSYSKAHQFAYIQAYGPIPDGCEIDHICESRTCQNPRHLRAVSHRENLSHGRTKAAMWALRTHCSKGHEYSPENTHLYRGTRYCLTCRPWAVKYVEAK